MEKTYDHVHWGYANFFCKETLDSNALDEGMSLRK